MEKSRSTGALPNYNRSGDTEQAFSGQIGNLAHEIGMHWVYCLFGKSVAVKLERVFQEKDEPAGGGRLNSQPTGSLLGRRHSPRANVVVFNDVIDVPK
jgi:hypothetical protein